MKVKRVCYIDDGVKLAGLLITRIFCRPVFYPMNPGCGFDAQVIYPEHRKNLRPYTGKE